MVGGQIQAAFNKARDAANLGTDVTPHTLRHTWATWFYSQTKDFVRLRTLGGWRSVETVMVYTKLAPRTLPGDLTNFGWDFNERILPTENKREHLLKGNYD